MKFNSKNYSFNSFSIKFNSKNYSFNSFSTKFNSKIYSKSRNWLYSIQWNIHSIRKRGYRTGLLKSQVLTWKTHQLLHLSKLCALKPGFKKLSSLCMSWIFCVAASRGSLLIRESFKTLWRRWWRKTRGFCYVMLYILFRGFLQKAWLYQSWCLPLKLLEVHLLPATDFREVLIYFYLDSPCEMLTCANFRYVYEWGRKLLGGSDEVDLQ